MFTKVGGSIHVTPDRFRYKKSCVEFTDSKEPNCTERASLGADAFNSVKLEVEYLLKKDTMLQKKIRSISSEDFGYKPSWRLNDRQKAQEAESFGSESSEVKETPLINPQLCEIGSWQYQGKDAHENSFCYENPDHQKPTRPSKDKQINTYRKPSYKSLIPRVNGSKNVSANISKINSVLGRSSYIWADAPAYFTDRESRAPQPNFSSPDRDPMTDRVRDSPDQFKIYRSTNHLATRVSDERLRLLEIVNRPCLSYSPKPQRSTTPPTTPPLLLLTADRIGGLNMFSTENETLLKSYDRCHSAPISSLAVAPKTQFLLTSDENGFLKQFSLKTHSLIKDWGKIHLVTINSMVLTEDEQFLFSGDS
jgi:hypothetical protein